MSQIGITNMYNSGGAVEAVDSSDSSGSKIHITGRGGGDFGAYSNLKPKWTVMHHMQDKALMMIHNP